MHLSIVPQHHFQLFIPLKLQTPTSTMMPSNWALSKEKTRTHNSTPLSFNRIHSIHWKIYAMAYSDRNENIKLISLNLITNI